ncbi:hypothetical protein DFH06DRAFT_1339268 [Mycena polygramma]|nr:hypothetical protein DFH06DRAFT_1352569 [Mycena polygramma]KAJ7626576.1 hypothetical protein DFH06DRAFT_1339268 [Mycena polygramma]
MEISPMRAYTLQDVEDALLTPPSRTDGPGKVYGLRVKHPDGSIVLKVGRSDDPPRRTIEWRCQCPDNVIDLLWEVPTEYAKKLERVSHRYFKAKKAWYIPVPCNSCTRRHQEKFWAQVVGGFHAAKKVVEELERRMRE